MIELQRVSVAFGDKQVLSDFSYRFEPGGQYALFGPSGCGKTTLLRVIAGLQKPDRGEVIHAQALRMAFCFQEDRLLPWYTSAENLALTLGSKEKAAEWLARVQLADAASLYPDELSGGMRRRVSLARALGFESDVLVLDEPLRELDAATCERMLRLVDESVGERLLVLVTHDRTQAERLGCRMIDMPV